VSRPRLVVTGASGFVGRHLLEELKEDYEITGIARRSQVRSGAPVHPSIRWHQADIGDREALVPIFDRLRSEGGVDLLLHLAAHYDFTGDEHPEYWRTNVEGLRNVLELSKGLGLRRFVFSSSTAACAFPRPGLALTETSPPDGDHVYARTKALGEAMLAEYRDHFPSTTVRFAALFSDWCEYPPLFMFLETWLSGAWNARLLGGRGRSAIPYLHVDDLVLFFLALFDRLPQVEPGAILQASPDGCVSHAQLFEEATLVALGRRARAVHVPRPLCGPGTWARDVAGRLIGRRPFERPWMARYVDLEMTIDASRTRERLGWEPRPRLHVLRRLPFLLENRRVDPVEWSRANRAAMKEVHVETNLRIYALLRKHASEIAAEFTETLTGPEGRLRFPSYQQVSGDDHQWNHTLVLRHLMNAVRTRERSILVSYCRDLALRRFRQGFPSREVCDALRELNRIVFKVLRRDPEADGLRPDIYEHVTMTLTWGCDEAQQVFDHLEARVRGGRGRPGGGRSEGAERPGRLGEGTAEEGVASIASKSDESTE
jgi:nucleoside-diphosphate-sugar epimerase